MVDAAEEFPRPHPARPPAEERPSSPPRRPRPTDRPPTVTSPAAGQLTDTTGAARPAPGEEVVSSGAGPEPMVAERRPLAPPTSGRSGPAANTPPEPNPRPRAAVNAAETRAAPTAGQSAAASEGPALPRPRAGESQADTRTALTGGESIIRSERSALPPGRVAASAQAQPTPQPRPTSTARPVEASESMTESGQGLAGRLRLNGERAVEVGERARAAGSSSPDQPQRSTPVDDQTNLAGASTRATTWSGSAERRQAQTRRRELDTDGIPIPQEPRGLVVEAHRKAQKRQQRRLQAQAAEATAGAGPALGTSGPSLTHSNKSPGATPVVKPGERTQRAPGGEPVAPELALPQQQSGAAMVPPLMTGQLSSLSGTPQSTGQRADDEYPPTTLAGRWEEEWRAAIRSELGQACCQNCRDFRAADSTGRGWCVNPFAFPTQQVVHGDDIACLSAIGTWWIANDQVWLDKIKVTAGTPTPLTDGMIELLRMPRRGVRR